MWVRERLGPFLTIYIGVALRCRFRRDLDHFRPFCKGLHSDVGFGKIWPILGYLWRSCTPMSVRERFEPFSTIYQRVALRCRFRRDLDHFRGCSPMWAWSRLTKKIFEGLHSDVGLYEKSVALRCGFIRERRCTPKWVSETKKLQSDVGPGYIQLL